MQSRRYAAALALMALLAAMFPANVYAAQQGLFIAGQEASPLIWRLPLQLFWMWALWWVRSDGAQRAGRRAGLKTRPYVRLIDDDQWRGRGCRSAQP